jgi:hypothetical protein
LDHVCFLFAVPSAAYCDVQPKEPLQEEMLREAEEFVANLDESGLEKMNEIKQLREILQGENVEVCIIISMNLAQYHHLI